MNQRGEHMVVQRYSRNEMHAIISNILKTEITLLPIGNHELRRHLVYKVKTKDGDFVFKYYYQDTYGGREISTLRLIKDTKIKHAELIDYGTFGESREWLMMRLLDGMPMDKIQKHLSQGCLEEIYESMGENLAMLHELKTFDFFGSLQADLTPKHPFESFREAFVDHNDYVFTKIKNSDLDAKDFLMHGIRIVEQNLDKLEHVTEARLTHFDFSPRNIFVSKVDGTRQLSAVLDYELCRPWDKNADFTQLMLHDFSDNKQLEEAFFKGYLKHSKLDESFYKTLDLYTLNHCIHVCSWAKDIAPDYYQKAYDKMLKLITESKNL